MTAMSAGRQVSVPSRADVRATKARSVSAAASTAADSLDTAPNFTSIYASSIFAMAVLFLVGVGVPISLYLDDFVAGFGLGAFCAFWGGPSFGVMAACARLAD